ncbi:MAG: HAD-IIB family hydrolase, partial [Desulfamplus sp.]|nr:HAD-IIB family hydrolase [Desulfamplus sp.]
MFVTDLDGTLFTDDKRIDAIDLDALKYLGKVGIVRAFATGRSLYSFQKAVKKMGFDPSCKDLPVDYVLFSTGAGIMECESGNIIKSHSLNSEDVRLIADYFDSLNLDYMIHRPVPDTPYCIYREQSVIQNPDFTSRIELYRDFCTKINCQEEIQEFGPSTEVLTIVPSGWGHKTADMVEQYLADYSVIRATSPLDGRSIWIEVFNRSVSKSKAVSWLAQRLFIDRQNVISIGNDYNDLDMLHWAGQGFVVQNAPESFKEHFTAVASNNECGVSQA